MKKMKFFCFGNPLVAKDRVPILIIPELREAFPEIEFMEAEGPEDVGWDSEVNIIDTVEGIERVRRVL
ncbi:MAG: hypothetical protein NT039_04685, partial [Candidatus Berkelbacteria bacterium]|nr:hypothetical protein [Candidatus Berkelbacteria bacterium]